MEVNGWRLFNHPLFQKQFEKLLSDAVRIQKEHPDTFANHKTVKLLKRITDLITEEIPEDPAHSKFNQGNTLGTTYRHWKRAKFGRYRLSFRFDARTSEEGRGKAIIYAWVNDDKTLRKAGDKNDPYALFARGLQKGKPPDSLEQLMIEANELDIGE